MTFTSYALNDDERAVFIRELQRSEWGEVLGLLELDTTANLNALLSDLDELLTEAPALDPEQKPSSPDTNPFSAVTIGFIPPHTRSLLGH